MRKSPGRFTARDPAGFGGSPRSLYGYANSSPVTFLDPGGTVSVTFSGYFGLGGGATIHFEPSAFFDRSKPFLTGFCVEGGVGAGGGIEMDALEEAPTRTGLSAFAEVSGKAGLAGAKLGGEFDLICGTSKGKAGGNLGPLQYGTDSDGTQSAGPGLAPGSASDNLGRGLGDLLGWVKGVKPEGKAGLKFCLPPPPR